MISINQVNLLTVHGHLYVSFAHKRGIYWFIDPHNIEMSSYCINLLTNLITVESNWYQYEFAVNMLNEHSKIIKQMLVYYTDITFMAFVVFLFNIQY